MSYFAPGLDACITSGLKSYNVFISCNDSGNASGITLYPSPCAHIHTNKNNCIDQPINQITTIDCNGNIYTYTTCVFLSLSIYLDMGRI